MNKFQEGLLNIWEAPQNGLGFIMSRLWKKRLIILSQRELEHLYGLEELVSAKTGYKVKIFVADYYSHLNDKVLRSISGFSMGRYICLNSAHDIETLKHEIGHCWQSQRWGWLYLLVVGIWSAVFTNMWSRRFHKHWCYYDKHYWYYKVRYWFEGQADKKGNVRRDEVLRSIPRPVSAKYPAMDGQVAA